MTRSRRGFPLQTRSRRNTDWSFGPDSVDQTASASLSLLWSTGLQPTGDGFTLVRTRGALNMYLTVATAAGDGFSGASGLCIVTVDAFNAGVASLPDPIADAGSDIWFWHEFFDIHTLTTTLADGVNAVGAHVRIAIDSKAMRKMDGTMVIAGVTQFVERGTATVEHHADTRILVKPY